jgi:hypothetical protein
MNRLQCALALLGDCGRALQTQISAGLTVPLDVEADDRRVDGMPTKRLDLCDELPGSLCSNGYGSLEVGGLRDRVDD